MKLDDLSQSGIVTSAYVNAGQPTLSNTEIIVGEAIKYTEKNGVSSCLEKMGLTNEQLREAIIYCRKRVCEEKAILYCDGCSMRNKEWESLKEKKARKKCWELADKIYEKCRKNKIVKS